VIRPARMTQLPSLRPNSRKPSPATAAAQLKFEPDGYPCWQVRPRRPGLIGEQRSPAGSRRPSHLTTWRLLYGPRVKLKPLGGP
jgi:hypothetical protein